MRNVLSVVFMIFMSMSLAGCATTDKVVPVHDEVLVYELPYDLTYLRTLDAVSSKSDWQLEETDKEKGIIKIRNTNYSSWSDKDQRTLSFTISRIDRSHTSVALAPESQKTLDGGDMLKVIGDMLAAEK